MGQYSNEVSALSQLMNSPHIVRFYGISKFEQQV